MERVYKYINIKPIPTNDNRVTRVCEIRNNNSDDLLGVIKWYAPWRQYCFYPSSDTIYSMSCMLDILYYIDTLMAERRTNA